MMNAHRSSNGKTGKTVHPPSPASRQDVVGMDDAYLRFLDNVRLMAVDMPSEEHDIECTIISRNERARKGIERLPREILETIFGFYRQDAMALSGGRPWEWHRLFHVCQTWRTIITDSTHRLGLRLFCTNGTPVRNTLHCWPNFPIVMRYGVFPGPNPMFAGDEDGIVAALQKPGRIWRIHLTLTELLLDKLATITQEPLPTMELLQLTSQSDTGLVLPNQFLRGEAPRLHTLRTVKIAFPALPQLLLSAKNIVSIQLEAIPSRGYISPDDLITSLSGMTCLQMFHIHFLSPTYDPLLDLDESSQYLPKHVFLPALKHLEFHGAHEYLEYLLAAIDAPVKYIYITFFNDLDFSNLPQLQQFIACLTKTQEFPDAATIHYSRTNISITFTQLGMPLRLGLRISCRRFDWQMASLAEICTQIRPPGSNPALRQVDIYASPPFPDEHDGADTSPFLSLLRVFDDVEILRVIKDIGSHVAQALSSNTVLPRVREIYIEQHEEFASVQQALAPFIAARRRSDCPVALNPWQPNNDFHPSPHLPRDAPMSAPQPLIHRNDPASMLEEDVRGMSERFDHHPFAIQSLYQRAQFLLLSFIQRREREKLDSSIEIARDLLDMRPRQIRRVELFRMLAFCFALGNHDPNHREESVSKFGDAFRDESATTSEKLSIAWWWATFARAWDYSSASLAYQSTLSALQSSLMGTFTVQRQHATIGRLGSKFQIPSEYASYRIERGHLELAVETIEQGKTLIWSEIYGIRPFVGRLRKVNPDLADRLATVGENLVATNASISTHGVSGSSQLDMEEDYENMVNSSPMFKKRRRLLRERQDVIAEIKNLPGFENFMETIPFRTLQHAASRGPIIMINHCPWRCDIIIVLHNSPASLIPMPDGFYERANTLASTLADSRTKHGVESELYQQELRSILKELHERVGQPVINKLGELGVPEQSRVWWYPTSVLCSLPLHAMGPVSSADGRDRYFSDLYICSYTPSLYALITARAAAAPISDPGPTLLFVGRPTKSPLSTRDMKVIRSIGVPATRLVFGNATREAVINGLQKHRLAHFACGSHRERGKPFDTALELDGGDRLALLDLVRARVPAAELAVLAAGATADLVDGTDFVEGLSLAAAMQYYGFGSVVGTMWALGDGGAEDLSLGFYNQMISGGAGDNTSEPLAERSAMALRYTVQKLREKRVTLQRWVNWVHYGA